MIDKISQVEIDKQFEFMNKIKNMREKRRYFINTMGCKLNEADSEKIAGMLDNMGFTETTNYDDANIVVFNTCSIRENAEEKVFGKLRRAKEY